MLQTQSCLRAVPSLCSARVMLSVPVSSCSLLLLCRELIRTAHNSFRTTSPFDWADDDDEKGKEDAFHFISYLYFSGKAYEMDGLQSVRPLTTQHEQQVPLLFFL